MTVSDGLGQAKKSRQQVEFAILSSDISRGTRGKSESLGILLLLLTTKSAMKSAGWNQILSVFTKEFDLLAKGIVIDIPRVGNVLFFALQTMTVGDIPARKEFLGFSPSTTCPSPCHVCPGDLLDFVDIEKPCEIRYLSQLTKYLERNENITGV